jgi:predicted RNA-binding protein with RPS1 domain
MSEQQVNEATASETLVDNTPATEAPATEAPAAETPALETPASETPASEAPVTETPAAVVAAAATPAPTAQAATPEDAGAEGAGIDASTVVRMLSVGQQVKGAVKRITEFGAFVDIGVGRDGLVHISELSAKRVGKVSDVLQEGQEVMLWIKKLDRDRNRISLTMIEPGKRTIRDLQKGEVVEGTVTRLLPYGAFIDIGIGRDALLHVREMGEGFIAKPEDVVQVGQMVEVRVIEIARRRSRVDLSMKGLRPEPEASAAAHQSEPERAPEPEPEPELQDEFADMEVLTPMQLAFKRAQEKSGVVLPTSKPGKGRRNDTNKKRAQQEDIISRTLNTGKK